MNNVQQRSKWKFKENNGRKIGDLALLKDDNLPSTKWLTGRITELFYGTDTKVRVVNLWLSNGKMLKRSVRNICILPIEE